MIDTRAARASLERGAIGSHLETSYLLQAAYDEIDLQRAQISRLEAELAEVKGLVHDSTHPELESSQLADQRENCELYFKKWGRQAWYLAERGPANRIHAEDVVLYCDEIKALRAKLASRA